MNTCATCRHSGPAPQWVPGDYRMCRLVQDFSYEGTPAAACETPLFVRPQFGCNQWRAPPLIVEGRIEPMTEDKLMNVRSRVKS